MSCRSPSDEETYFAKPAHLFPSLEDGKIPTEQFLSACQGIADFVGEQARCSATPILSMGRNVVRIACTDKARRSFVPLAIA
ncbi:unnamed protein product [Strongylus vulgaris]|uniref:Uncharacterized protein n=1 Tax=Strongylus vulgaris TaxID=40348 RepID=A0A3P7IG37_STRVU|nr:unnamed protein product [Strongylus vulgaris]